MTQLKMLTTDDKIAEIRRLYFDTSKQTIEADLAKALGLLKSMASEEERERATVFMEGLAEMRNDWLRERATPPQRSSKGRSARTQSARTSRSNSGGPQSTATPPQSGTRPASARQRPPRKGGHAKPDKMR